MADADKPKESMLDRMKEKAKEVQSSVKEKVADISEAGAEKAREVQGSVKEKIADGVEKAKEVQSTVKDKISDISEAATDKLKEVVAEINDVLPFIRELGYTVQGIGVGVGLIPDISIDVSGLTKVMDQETFGRTVEEQKEKKLLVGVLRALQAASLLQQKIKLGQMKADNATVTLGLPPKITLKFK